ncbi:MAG TPA: 50S ribosomal protein L15 [Bacteroidales bacterium]|jgi:large subunit ribosomal protein L15|nr:50S ribosomal protein L15 [Bacteroidales bacterium]HBA12859.1 50S ribosomal protein L15 [Bacteroidales bacterium]
MKLNRLKPAKGSTHSSKRIGRGPGSGMGGTSTRGHKGAKSRSGYSKKVGFEGGQMPLQRLVPKFGFKNINHVEYKAINLDTIQALADKKNLEKVSLNDLVAAGFVSSKQLVKILGNGKLTKKIDVEANAFSKSAVAAIEALGGTAIKI